MWTTFVYWRNQSLDCLNNQLENNSIFIYRCQCKCHPHFKLTSALYCNENKNKLNFHRFLRSLAQQCYYHRDKQCKCTDCSVSNSSCGKNEKTINLFAISLSGSKSLTTVKTFAESFALARRAEKKSGNEREWIVFSMHPTRQINAECKNEERKKNF